MRKICKKKAKLYEKLDTHKESERRFNFNDKEREEYTIRHNENSMHFEKLEDLVRNTQTYKYYDNSKRFVLDYCRRKPCIIVEINRW
jgi:hypothetical protein